MQHDDTEVDELLKILERKTDKKLKVRPEFLTLKRRLTRNKNTKTRVNDQKKVHEFIAVNEYKPGTYFIEGFILYYYFRRWDESRGRKVKKANVSYKNFYDMLKTYFDIKIDKVNTIFFGINKDLRKESLTPQKEAAIRRWTKNENKIKRQSQKKNKPQKKIQD